jgi:hypothetical protein
MQSSAPYRINQAMFIEHAAAQNEVKLWLAERYAYILHWPTFQKTLHCVRLKVLSVIPPTHDMIFVHVFNAEVAYCRYTLSGVRSDRHLYRKRVERLRGSWI